MPETLYRISGLGERWANELRRDPVFRVVEEIVPDEIYGDYTVVHAYVPASGLPELAALLVRTEESGLAQVQEVRPDGSTSDHYVRWNKGSAESGDESSEESILRQIRRVR